MVSNFPWIGHGGLELDGAKGEFTEPHWKLITCHFTKYSVCTKPRTTKLDGCNCQKYLHKT